MPKIQEITEFNFPSKEKYLRRDYKKRAQTDVKETIQKVVIIFLVITLGLLFMNVLTARAQSVLLYDDARVNQVVEECESKVRSLMEV